MEKWTWVHHCFWKNTTICFIFFKYLRKLKSVWKNTAARCWSSYWLIEQAVIHFWTLALLRGVFTSCWMELCCLCLPVFSFYGKLLTVASYLSYRYDYQSSQQVSEQICSICQKSNKFLKNIFNKLFIKIRPDMMCFAVVAVSLWNISAFLKANISIKR